MEKEKDLPLAVTEKENLRELVKKSDVVFEGVVIAVEKPPQNWSGYFTEYQTVRYRIEQVLKGNHEAVEIAVDHVVVSGSSTAATDAPALISEALFRQTRG